MCDAADHRENILQVDTKIFEVIRTLDFFLIHYEPKEEISPCAHISVKSLLPSYLYVLKPKKSKLSLAKKKHTHTVGAT